MSLKPKIYNTVFFLNSKITVLGFPPLIMVGILFSIVFITSIAFVYDIFFLQVLTSLSIVVLIVLIIKNYRRKKTNPNSLNIIQSYIYYNKIKNYKDDNSYLNTIYNE